MLIAVNYHYVREAFNEPYPGIFGITPKQLEAQLKILGTMGTFVSGEQVEKAIKNGSELPEKAIIITMDDGLREQFEVALPVFDKLGIPVVIYINTNHIAGKGKVSGMHKIHLLLAHMPFNELREQVSIKAVELLSKSIDDVDKSKASINYSYDSEERAILKQFLNQEMSVEEQDLVSGHIFTEFFTEGEDKTCNSLYMDESQVKKLSDSGYLGSHSHRHIPLGMYSDEAISQDISTSSDIIRSITGKKPGFISYPYGSKAAVTNAVLDISASHGFNFGFSMERAGNINFDNPLGLARFDCNDLPGGKSPLFSQEMFFDNIPVSSWFNKNLILQP